MGFVEYIKWLFCSIIYSRRTCDTCLGSNGNCDKCDEVTKNLYRRDYKRCHDYRQSRKNNRYRW